MKKKRNEMKSSLIKHVTVPRVLLLVLLACAAVSIRWALQVNTDCITVCTKGSLKSVFNDDIRTTSNCLPSLSSTVPELSSTKRDYHRDQSQTSFIESTTALSLHTDQKRTVAVSSSFQIQTSPLFSMAASVDSNCMLPLFCSSKLVRNCITNDIIGHLPNSVRSYRMKATKRRSVETSDMRRQSFKKVFESRAWGHDWDMQYKGLNASGECYYLLLFCKACGAVGIQYHWVK